ncbi:protein YebE [Aureimonas sp. SA4125]|uniref:tellurite resistance TerB family protein n=1 Tax=Aureimonas sp. SA4125 TaxID=2826993 RepID=UPI001CC33878|nr:tellurite resistance TerB family protein [Aureimonas sp. SA4125]BDA86656.1 protein YebE [Aureimonas sp. SA4125]
MFDVQNLLGRFLGAGTAGTGAEGRSTAPDDRADTAGSLEDAIGTLLRNPAASALAGGLAGGLAASLFGGRTLGTSGKAALQVGGAALIASLAYAAYENYRTSTPAGGLPPSADAAPSAAVTAAEFSVHSPDQSDDDWACLLLSAMIAAAKADGYIDPAEEKEILGRLDSLDLDPEERNFVRREMQKPQTIDALVAGATTPEAALQIYTASFLAIDPDHPAEQAYLARLAISLGLPSALTAEVRRAAKAAAGD